MTTPGFTAAASLYETRFHYVTLASTSSGGIVPQLSAGGQGELDDFCRYCCDLCLAGWYLDACITCLACLIVEGPVRVGAGLRLGMPSALAVNGG
jgi:hypothetical protein